jgi:hypothetical protein
MKRWSDPSMPQDLIDVLPARLERTLSMIERLGKLKERGLLTEQEFQTKKAEILAVQPRETPQEQDQASAPDTEAELAEVSNARADAMIARYLASNGSPAPHADMATQAKPVATQAKPVFGKRR